MENRKIKNATEIEYNNIKFKSKLECSAYKELEKSGLMFFYEPSKITLIEGFKPTVPFYKKDKKTKKLKLDNSKLRDTTYTPDFIVINDGWAFIIEMKGMKNDVYPYKMKTLRKNLENLEYVEVDRYKFSDFAIFELYSIKELKEAVNIIKNK